MADPAAEFFKAHARRAFNLALRLCGDPAEAEDISQEALLRALKALPDFRGEADPGSWVHRITVNVWKNRLRAETSRGLGKKVKLDPEEPRFVAPEVPALDRLEKAELEAQVQKALLELDEDDRAVVVLKDLERMSYPQIAEALGVPEGTVKSRLSRAREELRRRLTRILKGGRP